MLVNGKTLEQVMSELKRAERKEGTMCGYPYFKYGQFKERMDAVLGFHYNTEYIPTQLMMCGEQPVIGCVCVITILSDDFKPVLSRSGYGGKEVKTYHEATKYDSPGKNVANAKREAFKEACRDLGVFDDCGDDEEYGDYSRQFKNGKRVSGDSNSGTALKTAGNSAKTSGLKEGTFLTHSVMTSDTKHNGEVVYTLNVMDGSSERKVIFYENQYKKVSDIFEEKRDYLLTADLVKGVELSILYSEGSMGGLIFKGFSKKEGR